MRGFLCQASWQRQQQTKMTMTMMMMREFLRKESLHTSTFRRKRSHRWHTGRHQPVTVAVEVPESKEYLDTPTLPLAVGMVAVAVLAKITLMHDESKEQERTERRAKKDADLGTVRQLSREEWDYIQQLRPRTPFESKIARPNARLRTGERLSWVDLKDWAIDVLTDALTKIDENLRR